MELGYWILTVIGWGLLAVNWIDTYYLRKLYKQRDDLKNKHIEALQKQLSSVNRNRQMGRNALRQLEDLANKGKLKDLTSHRVEEYEDEWAEILEDPKNDRR